MAKYISWVDSLDWRVHGFLSLGGFLDWRSTHLSFYNIYSSYHLLFFCPNPILQPQPKTFQILFHTSKTFPKTLFHPRNHKHHHPQPYRIPNLRETPNSCIALAYLKKTRKTQTSSKKSCFASNKTRNFPNLKSFILNLNSIINKPQISPITFETRHIPYPSKLHPIP